MSVYSLSPIFNPQFIANAAAALTFAPAGGTVVPNNTLYQISVLRVANVTGNPQTLELWRVPNGAADDNQHIVVPQITIPVATSTFDHFDVTALWGAVLQAGDAIWAVCGNASALSIQGDGAVITP
jgi:hypothetical protein